MKHHALYDPVTGLFVGRTFSTDMQDPVFRDRSVAANTPPGLAMAEGVFDHLSQRVDLEKVAALRTAHETAHAARVAALRVQHDATSAANALGPREFVEPPVSLFMVTADVVVDYQPPQPSAEHEWDGAIKRWVPNAAVLERQQAARIAAARHAELGAQEGPLLRRLVLHPDDAEAHAALEALDAEIEILRAYLSESNANGA